MAAEQTLEVGLPSTPIWVYGDGTRLVQIFANVLNNAVKFTPRGGQIWFTAEQQADQAVVSIRDTGMASPQRPAAGVRDVPAGGADARTVGGRPRHRADAGAAAGRDARRPYPYRPGNGPGNRGRDPSADHRGAPGASRADEQPPVAARHNLRVLIVEDNLDAAEMLEPDGVKPGSRHQAGHDGASADCRARVRA